MKKILLALGVFFLVGLTVSCQDTTIEHDIYVTVYTLQYVVEEIVQDTPITVGIVPGVTSHSSSVDWSIKEIIAMTKAVYLFYVGANYDQYIDLQIDSILSDRNVELVKLENETEYIEFMLGLYDSHVHEDEESDTTETTTASSLLGYDPHFWISPERVAQAALLIFDKLVLKYPEYEALMQTNYDELIANLDSLSQAILAVTSVQVKPLLTSTNIYGYLREDYGLHYMSISPGYHEETEQFTSQEKEAIVNEAMLHNIHHIIFERNITSPLSSAVYDALMAAGYNPIKLEYDILQTLTDADRNADKDYLSIMYDNLELIKQATDYYWIEE